MNFSFIVLSFECFFFLEEVIIDNIDVIGLFVRSFAFSVSCGRKKEMVIEMNSEIVRMRKRKKRKIFILVGSFLHNARPSSLNTMTVHVHTFFHIHIHE